MATKFKFEIESDGLTVEQSQAFSDFVKSLGAATVEHSQAFSTFVKSLGMATEALQPLQDETSEQETTEAPEPAKKKRASRAKAEEPQAEEPQAEEPQAEEPQAEEPQAEEPQAEETKTSAFSIQDVRDRVKEKQGKWRTSIKAELERLGSSSVSLLAPEHFEEFCNFMDKLA